MMNPAMAAAIMLPATVGAITGRHTNVTNNTIVYSDTVLNLKDFGRNIKVQSISNVGECSFERCVEIICENNPNVTFNTIQYSRSDKTVYFYTDDVISTKEWYKTNITRNAYAKINIEVLEDLKNILTYEQECPRDAVTLYDVIEISRFAYANIEEIKKAFIDQMDYRLNGKSSRYYCSSSPAFDYLTKELELSIHFHDWYRTKFKKENGDLYISEYDNNLYKDDILPLLGNCLTELYDAFLTFEDFYIQRTTPKTINSGFYAEINRYGVGLAIPKNWLEKDFELFLRNSTDNYDYKCNSNNIIELLKDNEIELFQRIFVKIDDCPEWMKGALYNLRQKQLQKEQEEQEKSSKKEKRLRFVKKVLPFI